MKSTKTKEKWKMYFEIGLKCGSFANGEYFRVNVPVFAEKMVDAIILAEKFEFANKKCENLVIDAREIDFARFCELKNDLRRDEVLKCKTSRDQRFYAVLSHRFVREFELKRENCKKIEKFNEVMCCCNFKAA